MWKRGNDGKFHREEGPGVNPNPDATDQNPTFSEEGLSVENRANVTRCHESFQSEIKQQIRDMEKDMNAKVENFQDDQKATSRRIGGIEYIVKCLQDRIAELEKLMKKEICPKVYAAPEADGVEQLSAQLMKNDSAHQEELYKLQQQHHEDMLSVINDCCRKLKSGFTRQNRPYEVGEIHAIIDDIQQKMVQEILSEIQKTNTHEDLSTFEEALTKSEFSSELKEVAEDTRYPTGLNPDDITAALETFDSESFGGWSEELKPTGDIGSGDVEGPQEPIVEEVITRDDADIMGDRGNLYYAEELKKTVTGIISVDEKTASKQNTEEFVPDLPPKTRNYEEIEQSLDSLIISDDSSAQIRPPESTLDLDKRSFEELIVGNIIETAIPAKTKPSDTDKQKSTETKTDKGTKAIETAKSIGISDSDKLKVTEAAKEKDIKALETMDFSTDHGNLQHTNITQTDDIKALEALGLSVDLDDLKSLEATLEADIIKEEFKPIEAAEKPLTREEVRENLSESVAATASSPREEMHMVHPVGFQGNPYYVDEVVNAAVKETR